VPGHLSLSVGSTNSSEQASSNHCRARKTDSDTYS